jgi:hypothetical protein
MSDLFVTNVDLGVQNVHLLSGEDVIGHVFLDESKKSLRIENPVMPTISQDQQNGNYRVGLLPLRPYLDKVKAVDVPLSNVLYHIDAGERMRTLYTQFVSDIILPSSPNLSQILGGK